MFTKFGGINKRVHIMGTKFIERVIIGIFFLNIPFICCLTVLSSVSGLSTTVAYPWSFTRLLTQLLTSRCAATCERNVVHAINRIVTMMLASQA